MNRPSTERKKMFVSHYGLVYVDTDICRAWQRHHSNCGGCKHENQCKKYIDWLIDPDKFLDDDPENFTGQ